MHDMYFICQHLLQSVNLLFILYRLQQWKRQIAIELGHWRTNGVFNVCI